MGHLDFGLPGSELVSRGCGWAEARRHIGFGHRDGS